MGGKMIRNIIIIALLLVIVYDVSAEESLGYVTMGLKVLVIQIGLILKLVILVLLKQLGLI